MSADRTFENGEKCLRVKLEAIQKVYSHVFELFFFTFQPEKAFTWFDGVVTHCVDVPLGVATKYAPLLLPLELAKTYAPLRFVFTGQEQCPILQLAQPEAVVEVSLITHYLYCTA